MAGQRILSNWKRNAALGALLVCGSVISSASLEAQITFTGVQSNVPITGSVQAIEAVDPAGNLFLVGSNTQIVRLGVDGTQSMTDITSAGFSQILNLSSDSAGNIYIFGVNTSSGWNVQLIELAANGSQTRLPAPFPTFGGVDGQGNLYFYDPLSSADIYKYSPGGSLLATINSGMPTGELDGLSVDLNGRLYLAGVAGELFVADPGNQYHPNYISTGTTYVAADSTSNFSASDAQGTVYFIWQNFVIGRPRNDSWQPAPVAVAAKRLSQIVADAKGDLFVQAVDGTVMRFQPNHGDFGNVNVCAQMLTPGCQQTLTANYAADFVARNGLSAQALTQGVAGQDYAVGGGVNTASPEPGTNSPVLLQTTVSFTPETAGSRMGAVQLVDDSGNARATGYLYGTGTAPQIAYGSGTKTTLATGLGTVHGMATDAAGNVFLVDSQAGTLLKITPGGLVTTMASGLTQPWGLALDGAGNVFVGEEPASVVKITPGGLQTTIASNVSFPNALAVDGAGNLFIARDATVLSQATTVVEITRDGVQKSLGTPGGNGTSMALDTAGDVYYGEGHCGCVYKITPDGQQSTVVSEANAAALQLDAAGDLWIFDEASNSVLEVTPAGVQTTFATGFNGPTSGALDSAGNLFLADSNGTSVVEIERSQPPVLKFAAASVGQTSSDSPQSVQVENIGNLPLTLTGLSVAANFAQVEGSGTPADCSAGTSIAAGTACNLGLSFTPAAVGSISGSVVLTDNALNANPATQSISLSGTGDLDPQTISFTGLPANATYGSGGPYALTAIASSGLAVSYSVTGPATIAGSSLSITGVGSVVVTASQAGNSDYSPATPISQTIMVGQATQSIAFGSIAAQTVGAKLDLTATATSGLAVSFASNTASVCSVSGTTATMLTAGTCTIEATQTGNTDYAAATAVTQSFNVSAPVTGTVNLIATPNSETIRRGDLAAFLLQAHSINGFSGQLTITCSGAISAVVCGSFPQTLTLQPNKMAVAISRILFPANITPGTYTLTFTATSGSTKVSTTARFKVED